MGSYRAWRHRKRIRSVRHFLRALPVEARAAAFLLLRGRWR